MRHIRATGRAMLAVVAVFMLLGLTGALRPQVAGAESAVAPEVYFDATGQTLGGAFLDGWLLQGGLSEAGKPVSPPVQQGNSWMQWFEFARLEVPNPAIDQATGEDVTPTAIGNSFAERLGLLRLHPAFKPVKREASDNVRVFDNGHTLANAFLDTYERHDAGARLGMPISEEFGVTGTVYQFFERGALSWTPDYGVNFVALGMYDAAMHSTLRLSGDRPEGVPSYAPGTFNPVPGNGGGKWIDVNLSTYTLTAFEGDAAVFSAPLVDGAPETPTIRGTFYTYWKLDSQTMRGRNTDGSEYLTENVPWVMYFYTDFAIHGAYWRSSFGYSGSHGCVNLPVSSAEWLYGWAPLGTQVVVRD